MEALLARFGMRPRTEEEVAAVQHLGGFLIDVHVLARGKVWKDS